MSDCSVSNSNLSNSIVSGSTVSSGDYAELFQPVPIGPVTAPNRFFAAPHATGHGWNQPAGAIALRAMKAEGGWGTVAVQMTEIAANSDMANHPMERIWDDSDLPRHTEQVEAIKHHGSLAAIELAHGGMRSRNITTGTPVIGPSALPILRPEVPLQARAMNKADITEFRDAHRAAAKRAFKAGYDILYVYAAHDLSLLSHFLSCRTNQRNDEYGGTLENRMRLLREVLEDTLEVANGERAVAIRFSVAEPSQPQGLRHDAEGRDVVEALAELPDLWDVNLSSWPDDSATARFADEGFQLPFTDFVKTVTTKPVVGVGRFTSPDLMVSLIRKGRLDLIGAARPSIADPFLPAKIRDGRIDEIRECIGCNICVSMDAYGLPLRCTQNPTISEEWRRGWHPDKPIPSKPQNSVNTSKRHLIVGAGPAGLECAHTLLRAGHHVTLAERDTEAGGRALRESRLPGLASWIRVRDYRMHQLMQSNKAEIYLSSTMSAEDILEFDAASITLATGSTWRNDGSGATALQRKLKSTARFQRVLDPDTVMNWAANSGSLPADLQPSSSFVVYDDDHFYMASSIAEMLVEYGHKVVYVTPLGYVATWTDYTLEQERIVDRLSGLGVALYPNTRLTDESKFVNTLNGEEQVFNTLENNNRQLVIVGSRLPDDELFETMQVQTDLQEPDSPVLYRAGDCLVPGIIQAAVLSGHHTAREILGEAPASESPLRQQVFS